VVQQPPQAASTHRPTHIRPVSHHSHGHPYTFQSRPCHSIRYSSNRHGTNFPRLSSAPPRTWPYISQHPLANTYAQGAKSIVVLAYQLSTSHVASLRKWASLKAYAILNCLEILFWFVVIILGLMGVTRFCMGTSCWLGWAVIVVALKIM